MPKVFMQWRTCMKDGMTQSQWWCRWGARTGCGATASWWAYLCSSWPCYMLVFGCISSITRKCCSLGFCCFKTAQAVASSTAEPSSHRVQWMVLLWMVKEVASKACMLCTLINMLWDTKHWRSMSLQCMHLSTQCANQAQKLLWSHPSWVSAHSSQSFCGLQWSQ